MSGLPSPLPPSLLEDPVYMPVSHDNSFGDGWFFCLVARSFLLFPPPADPGVLFSDQPLPCFSVCPNRHLGLPPLCICSPSLLSSLISFPDPVGSWEDAKIMLSLEHQALEVGKVVNSSSLRVLLPLTFWESRSGGSGGGTIPNFLEGVCAQCSEDGTAYAFLGPSQSTHNPSELVQYN